MNIGTGRLLIARGAILAWAVSATVLGIDVKIVGAGVVLTLMFWGNFAPFAGAPAVTDRALVVERVETRDDF